ncbi:MAG: hypothetical protein V1644_02845 [Candidatus Micrarchaeota archaeon]
MEELKLKLSAMPHLQVKLGPTTSGRGFCLRLHGSLSNRLTTEQTVIAAAKLSCLSNEVKGSGVRRSISIRPPGTTKRFCVFLKRAPEYRRKYYPEFEVVSYKTLTTDEREKIIEFFHKLK